MNEELEDNVIEMDDAPADQEAAPTPNLPIVKRGRKKLYAEEEFTQCLNVRVGENKEPLAIPVDGQQNAHANMVVAAKLRKLYGQTVDAYANSGDTMTPKELKDVMDAGKALIEITAMPYTGAPISNLPNSAGNTMHGLIAGMAAGVGAMAGMAAGGQQMADVLAKIENMGKKPGKAKTPLQVIESTIAKEAQ